MTVLLMRDYDGKMGPRDALGLDPTVVLRYPARDYPCHECGILYKEKITASGKFLLMKRPRHVPIIKARCRCE
jgi:hypothetical protein